MSFSERWGRISPKRGFFSPTDIYSFFTVGYVRNQRRSVEKFPRIFL